MGSIYLIVIVIGQECLISYGSSNLAKGRPTSSSTASSMSGRTVDGNTDPNWQGLSCWEAATGDMNPYWMVDLGSEFVINVVAVTNRGDCCWNRLRDFEIEVYSENPDQVTGAQRSLCKKYIGTVGPGALESISCSEPLAKGRYVKITGLNRVDGNDRFTLCEVQIYGRQINCLGCSLVRQEKMRNGGSVSVIPESSQSDCSNACFHKSTCVGFNYNPSSLVCEMVTVPGTFLSSVEWNYFSIMLCPAN